MYEVCQQWMSNGYQRKHDEEKAPEFDEWRRSLNDRELESIYQDACPEFNACKVYEDVCDQDSFLDDAYSEYFECTEIERDNGMVAYIGPIYGPDGDGESITLGIFDVLFSFFSA